MFYDFYVLYNDLVSHYFLPLLSPLIGAAFAAAAMLCSERGMKMPLGPCVCISFMSFVYL